MSAAAAMPDDGPDGYDAGSQEDDMGAAERDLAEDARWKLIQQNTFTRWANEHLKTAGKAIGNLETDLGDGLRLIALIEVLSGKRLPKHNKRPTFRSQKLENVSVALKFLDDENIKLVNIGECFFFCFFFFPTYTRLFIFVVPRVQKKKQRQSARNTFPLLRIKIINIIHFISNEFYISTYRF